MISFPQDSVGFFQRFGILKQFRVGDRVNSVRGPGGDVGRAVKLASDSSQELLERHAVDDLGQVVFAATVVHVFADGSLRLEYDEYSECGIELAESVRPRVQMPSEHWSWACVGGFGSAVVVRVSIDAGIDEIRPLADGEFGRPDAQVLRSASV